MSRVAKSAVCAIFSHGPITLSLQNMIAHIRYATQGEVSLENVHPFNRVWKGVQMTFCHNGDCPQFSNSAHCVAPLLGQTTENDVIYHPVGDTDSEAVFCAILNALTVEFPDGLPTLPVLHEFLSMLCAEIVQGHPETTIFNFLLGCGQYTLFAFSWPGRRGNSTVWNGLHYIIREPPFSTAKLLDTDYEIDFRRVTTPADRVAVITTKPLTEEPGWTEFKRGELLMFDKGLPYRTPKCCEVVEQQGRGLFSKAVKAKCSRSPSRANTLEHDRVAPSCPRNALGSSPSSVAMPANASRIVEPPPGSLPCLIPPKVLSAASTVSTVECENASSDDELSLPRLEHSLARATL
jgi:predicted glutamine amidotransferase